MSHSLVKIWVHIIIGVKYRENLISPKAERIVYRILAREINRKGSKLIFINGTENHIHLLIMLGSIVSISKLMQQVKGASSRLISRLKICSNDFSWQIGYGAFSVSETNLKWVIQYIKNQKIHHQEISYREEMKSLRRSS